MALRVSNHHPPEPEAFRLLAPQRGVYILDAIQRGCTSNLQAMSMSDSNDLYAGSGLAKNNRVWEPAKQNAARSMFERWKPLRLFGNLPNCIIYFVEEGFRRSLAALRIPIRGSMCFLKSIGMDVE
jgi:hypothetical protein